MSTSEENGIELGSGIAEVIESVPKVEIVEPAVVQNTAIMVDYALPEIDMKSVQLAIEEVASTRDKPCHSCGGRLQDEYGYRCKRCSGSGVEPKGYGSVVDRVDVKK